MKHTAIWKNLSNIREDYIEEAAPDGTTAPTRSPKSLQTHILRWGALAACLALVVGIAYPTITKLTNSNDPYSRYETRAEQDFLMIAPNAWRIFGFPYTVNGETVTLEFPAIEWEGVTYGLSQDANSYVSVPAESIGEVLCQGEVTAFGISEHEKTAAIPFTFSEYKGIDPSYGVVLTMEGVEEAVLYRTSKYADSFEELVEKVSLSRHLTTYPHIIHTVKTDKGEEVKIAFEKMTPEILWKELLSHGKTVDYDGEDGEYLRIGIGHDLLQYSSTLCVTQDGYVTFSMLEVGKAVYVGEERVEAFLTYLEENLTGYRLVEKVYTAPTGEMNTVTVTTQAYDPSQAE